MRLYEFKCLKCNKVFEELLKKEVKIGEQIEGSPCCNSEGIRIISRSQVLIKEKYRESGENRLDDGIPFGEVPGDDDYIGINEPGYIGPLP